MKIITSDGKRFFCGNDTLSGKDGEIFKPVIVNNKIVMYENIRLGHGKVSITVLEAHSLKYKMPLETDIFFDNTPPVPKK